MTNFTSNHQLMFDNGIWKEIHQPAPQEISVDLHVNGKFWLTFLCSPFQIEMLAVGFLFNEHIITNKTDLAHVHLCENKSTVDIWLNFSVEKPRNWVKTSGCTGGQTSNAAFKEPISPSEELICPKIILEQVQKLLNSQEQYRQTRGIHCSILTDGMQNNLKAEDIGRHNTIDKLAGQMLFDETSWMRKILVTTGRISSEMLQKSARLGASFVVSRTSPTQASIQTADELQICLIGYARRNQFIIYSHSEKIATTINLNEKITIFC